MGTHPIFESDFDCLTDERCRNSSKRSSMLGLEKKRTYGNESPKRQAEYLVKWNDIKYSDPNPKKWVLDSAYPSDKTSQKALKCFKDENPEKRLLLTDIIKWADGKVICSESKTTGKETKTSLI